MSLRWTAQVAPKPHIGGSKKQIVHFFLSSKSVLLSKTVCCKVPLCENFQQQTCKAFTGLSSRAQMAGGGCPLLPKIFNHSDQSGSKTAISNRYSLVAPQQLCLKKSSIITNRKSTTSFPMSLWWTAYVAPNPQKGAQKRKLFHFF